MRNGAVDETTLIPIHFSASKFSRSRPTAGAESSGRYIGFHSASKGQLSINQAMHLFVQNVLDRPLLDIG